jgi:hypothetical protein
VHPEVADFLAGFCDPVLPSADEGDRGVWPIQRVAELAADAAGLIVSMADSVDDALLSRCPRLRVVSATISARRLTRCGGRCRCRRRARSSRSWPAIGPTTR